MIAALFYLLCGHALADFPLQTEFITKGKNRHTASAGVPWPYVLSAHALMHGATVAIVTGDPRLGLAETVAHWLIDFGKCERWYGIHADQALHIGCKLAWLSLWCRL